MFICARVDFRRAIVMGVIVAASILTASCMLMGTRRGDANSGPNSANSNTAPSSSSFDSDKYRELLDKGNEMEKLSLPVKLDPKAAIKGKVFLVKSSLARTRNVSDYENAISDYRKARSLEEVGTVMRILCSKGKFLGDYYKKIPGTTDGSTYKDPIKAYGVDCQVSLIDYPARVVVAQKSFSNNEGGESILERSTGGEHVNPPPVGQITSYLNSFPVDKVLPAMLLPDEKELVRLPTTLDLKPDAAIRGKIKIAQKLERGDLDGYFSSIEGSDSFGFSYDRIAARAEELETLVRIICVKGSPIGRVEKSTQYSSKCEVSLIDYKTLTVLAQKTFENKTLDESGAAKGSFIRNWVVGPPKQEIESYLKSFPGAQG